MGTMNTIMSVISRLFLAVIAALGARWIVKRCVTRTRDGTVGVLIRLEQPRRAVHPGLSVFIPGVDRIETYSSLLQPWTDVVCVHSAQTIPIRLRINMTWAIDDVVAFHLHRTSIAHAIVTAVEHEAARIANQVGLEQIPDLRNFELVFAQGVQGRLTPIGVQVHTVTFSEITMPSAFYTARGSIAMAELRSDALQLEALSQSAVQRIGIATTATELAALHQVGRTVDEQAVRIYDSRTIREAARTGRLTVINTPTQVVPAISRSTPPPPPPPPPPPTVSPVPMPNRPMPPSTGPDERHRSRRSRSR